MWTIDSSSSIITEQSRNVNVELAPNQELVILDKNYIKKPSFIMVASGYGDTIMDYTKELLAMTPQEAFMFNLLMDNRKTPDISKPYIRSNYSTILGSTLTDAEKKKIYVGYKRLASKNLITRVKREHYLINPQLVITNDSLYEKELIDYLRLTK